MTEIVISGDSALLGVEPQPTIITESFDRLLIVNTGLPSNNTISRLIVPADLSLANSFAITHTRNTINVSTECVIDGEVIIPTAISVSSSSVVVDFSGCLPFNWANIVLFF
jgi:hypothetical protein